jgi:hypothetical protein
MKCCSYLWEELLFGAEKQIQVLGRTQINFPHYCRRIMFEISATSTLKWFWFGLGHKILGTGEFAFWENY